KSLLKEKNISFVALTPQVLAETNRKLYEKTILNQAPLLAPKAPLTPRTGTLRALMNGVASKLGGENPFFDEYGRLLRTHLNPEDRQALEKALQEGRDGGMGPGPGGAFGRGPGPGGRIIPPPTPPQPQNQAGLKGGARSAVGSSAPTRGQTWEIRTIKASRRLAHDSFAGDYERFSVSDKTPPPNGLLQWLTRDVLNGPDLKRFTFGADPKDLAFDADLKDLALDEVGIPSSGASARFPALVVSGRLGPSRSKWRFTLVFVGYPFNSTIQNSAILKKVGATIPVPDKATWDPKTGILTISGTRSAAAGSAEAGADMNRYAVRLSDRPGTVDKAEKELVGQTWGGARAAEDSEETTQLADELSVPAPIQEAFDQLEKELFDAPTLDRKHEVENWIEAIRQELNERQYVNALERMDLFFRDRNHKPYSDGKGRKKLEEAIFKHMALKIGDSQVPFYMRNQINQMKALIGRISTENGNQVPQQVRNEFSQKIEAYFKEREYGAVWELLKDYRAYVPKGYFGEYNNLMRNLGLSIRISLERTREWDAANARAVRVAQNNKARRDSNASPKLVLPESFCRFLTIRRLLKILWGTNWSLL
ncbi:MAG: hypothetical protein HYT89_07585, partial [Candidatus Omnitrophica bacterium]|nr:hypothetical protein [Candidatus Omnitrophota bacterium]